MADSTPTPAPAPTPAQLLEQAQAQAQGQLQPQPQAAPQSQSQSQLEHPFSLRPGRTSRSPSPSPLSHESSRESTMSSYQSPPLQRQRSPPNPRDNVNNYSGRFPSQTFPPQSPTRESVSSSANLFGDGKASSRSRSSTIGQNYPVAVQPPMPTSPPQSVQPLFAQHSGGAQQSSRPVSRSAASASASTSGSGPSTASVVMMQGALGGLNGGAGPSTRPTGSGRSPFSTPVTSLSRQRPQQILLINPNSTRSMTEACLNSIRPIIPMGVEVTGYTAPYPAPTAIESATDAIMSTEVVLRDLAKHAAVNGETVQNFDGMIVACFSKHPLIDALRESYDVPIIGIMEASLYVARMLGGRFGIVATGQRSKITQDDQVAGYGLSHFYVGSESTHLGVLELDLRPREEVAKRIAHASRSLVVKGADTILLGCAGMTDLTRAAKDAVRDEDGRRTVNVIDSVEAGVMVMTSLVGMGIPTSKKGLYKGEKEGRRTRGQNWL